MSLFKNKVFLFVNLQQYLHIGPDIYKYGGIVKCQSAFLNKSGFFEHCLDDNVIVMNCNELDKSGVKMFLEFNDKRLIDEKEVKMAILCMSTEKFTNPYCNEVLDLNDLSMEVLNGSNLQPLEDLDLASLEVSIKPSDGNDVLFNDLRLAAIKIDNYDFVQKVSLTDEEYLDAALVEEKDLALYAEKMI